MAYSVHGVYIADGFADDCNELMNRCVRVGTLDFAAFSDIWQEMQLSCIFHGRTSGAEIAELSEEVLHIAKHYMVADTSNFEESVAGLFLVYSLLNLQPFVNFASLRIVPEDVPAIERIGFVARRDRRQDVLYILGAVLIQGPVQYHAILRERGMEYPIRKYLEGYATMDKLGVRPKGVFYRQNAELDIIRELRNLTVKYSKAKENITGVNPCDRNLSYLDAEFPNELDKSLKAIISGNIGQKKKEKEEEPSEETALKNIKKKAMDAKVKPIKHRIAVSKSAPSKPHASDIKTSPGKVKNISPKKVVTSSKIIPKKATRKRVRKSRGCVSDSEGEDYVLKQVSEYETDYESRPEDLDLTKFDQIVLIDDVSQNSSKNQLVEIKLNDRALPSSLREDQGGSYEFEFIDKLNGEQDAEENTNFEEPIPSTSTSEGDTKKTVDKRDLKKTILKSRFKRLGMLPVANFETK